MSRTAMSKGYRSIEAEITTWDWLEHAACGDLDTELFFDEKNRLVPAIVHTTCNHCPVQKSCFLFAVQYREKGIWAGLKEEVRDFLVSALRRDMQDGEPRGEAVITREEVLDRIRSMSDSEFRWFLAHPRLRTQPHAARKTLAEQPRS